MRKNFFLLCIILLAPLLKANQIHYEYMSLEELVRSSDLIVVAKKMTPYWSTRKIEVKCYSSAKKSPPYTQIVYHMTIKEALFDKSGEKLAGKNIRIQMPDDESQIELQRKYYCEGISKSPIYRAYKRPAEVDDEDVQILFLKKEDGFFYYTAERAQESMRKKEQIVEMIKNKNKDK